MSKILIVKNNGLFHKGTYDLTSQAIPLYKMKQSAGFASNTRRMFDALTKPSSKQTNTSMNKSFHSQGGSRDFGFGQEIDDPFDMEEFIDV